MLDTQLDYLTAGGLLAQLEPPPEPVYGFRHALVQDAAYATLLYSNRRRIHRIVAETLETLYPEQGDELAPLLGRHFYAAGDALRALPYLQRAADRALARYAAVEAAQQYELALSVATTPADRSRLLAGLAEALQLQSRLTAALAAWRQAIPLYLEQGDVDQAARLWARAARAALSAGQPAQGLALGREGLAQLASLAATPGLATLLHETARACRVNGLPAEARQLARQAQLLARRWGDVATQAEALITLAALPPQAPRKSLAALRAAIRLAAPADVPATAARAYNNLALLVSFGLGDFRAGHRYYRHAAALAQRMGQADLELFYLSNATSMLLWLGRFAAIRRTIPILTALAARSVSVARPTYPLPFLEGLLLRFAGEEAAAIHCLRLCQADARARGDLQYLGFVCDDLGATLLASGDPAGAQVAFAEAWAIAERGLTLSPALTAWGLATAYLAQDRLVAAQAVCDQLAAHAAQPARLFDQVWVQWLAARLALVAGRPAAAWSAFAATEALLVQLRLPWYRARLAAEWAAAYATHGSPADLAHAAQLRATAVAEFQQLGVPRWAARVAATFPVEA
ncbi:MAG: hypothetical protein M3Z04_21605 [Chloroflexota bacterium]|nr:hypothetical protein [Chloroflexota bacterium]